jgi:hypothetical protein
MGTTITPDTPLYTYTADFAGYTLLDSILGDLNAQAFMAQFQDDAQELAMLCYWAGGAEGFWTSEADAIAWYDDVQEQGGRVTGELEQFTLRELLAQIKADAAILAEENEQQG